MKKKKKCNVFFINYIYISAGHVEALHIEKLRDVRKTGAGAPGGPSGTGQRQLFTGAGRDGVQSEVRRR